MASLSTVLAVVAAIAFVYNLLQFLRRPAKPLPPGPRPWPIVGNLPHMGSTPYLTLVEMKKKYGPLIHMKLGFTDTVIAMSGQVAAEFLKINDANFLARPTTGAGKYFAYNGEDMVFAEGARWRMLRKICSVHLFSGKALDDSRSVRQEELSVMVHELARTGPKPVTLNQKLNQCIANTMGQMILGRRVFGDASGQGDPKATEFKATMAELMVGTKTLNLEDFFEVMAWLDLNGVIAKLKKLNKWFDGFLSEIVEERKADVARGVKHADMLTTLLELQDDADEEGQRMTETHVKAMLLDLFILGSDPTTSTVEWGMAELIRHPAILARVRDEIDAVVGRDRMVAEHDLPKLPYLQAAIKEVYRLHPTAPFPVPRRAIESCEINGYHIPKGATLMVNVWAIARDPDKWSDPHGFHPERFLPGGEKANADVRGNDFDMIPFSAGRRICPGVNLAIRMVPHLTAALVHAFDWELPNGQLPEKLNMDEAYGVILARAEPLLVHPKPRLAPHVYTSN